MKMNIKDGLMTFAGAFAGVAITAYATKAASESETVGRLLGEETPGKTDTMKYVVPGLITVAGIVGAAMLNNKTAQAACVGAASVGAAKLVNGVSGSKVISLGATDDIVAPINSRSLIIPRAIPAQTPMYGSEKLPGTAGVKEALPGIVGGCY